MPYSAKRLRKKVSNHKIWLIIWYRSSAKKVLSNSPQLVNFVAGLVETILNAFCFVSQVLVGLARELSFAEENV